MKTYNDLYLDLRRTLREKGDEDSSQSAREIICTATGKSHEEFLRDARLYVTNDMQSRIEELAARHIGGEPVAYLIGEWSFYGLDLSISPAVLIPRPDTEVLVEQALAHIKPMGDCRVLDLCAGSGCIGIAIGKNAPQSRVYLGEIDEEALKICRQNIRRCGVSRNVVSMRMDALCKPARELGEFRVIVSNPPYIPTKDLAALDASVRDYEPHLALDGGEDGMLFYRNIILHWKDALCENGMLFFEVGIGQADDVLRLMRTNGFGDLQIVKDLHGIPRVVYGTLCQTVL